MLQIMASHQLTLLMMVLVFADNLCQSNCDHRMPPRTAREAIDVSQLSTPSSSSSVMTTTEDDHWSSIYRKTSGFSVPKLGFGDFKNENYDDEDYDTEAEIDRDKDGPRWPSTGGDDIGFKDSKILPSDYEAMLNYGSFVTEIERIAIVGNTVPPPTRNTVYSMQQAIPANYEGCFCDRHYQVDRSGDSGFDYTGFQHFETSSLQANSSINPVIREKGIFCSCFGESITEIPANFSTNVRKIVLKRIGLTVLKEDSLQKYTELKEIYMHAMHQLHLIEAGAFSHLPKLDTIIIKMAPALRHIPDGVFFGSIPKLMYLKITYSGLEQLPMIYQTKSDQIISVIDFDNCQIRNITTRSINVTAESLNIEYNQIEFVGNYAFYGSKIAKLSLKGNKKLVYLQELAFSGLNFLRVLDLSQTSITKLPTIGLSESLEFLRIMDTFSLKEIPFIYHFKHMKEAHLTYPYHCCAFQFPANHDPVEYARIKKLFNTDKYCTGKKSLEPKKTRLKRNTHFDTLDWLPSGIVRLLDYFVGHRGKRHAMDLSNQSQVYGVLVDGTNSTSTLSPYDVLETRFSKKSDDHQWQKSYKTSYVDLPGTFGTPHVSITPKQEFCGDIANQMPTVRCYPEPDAFNPCEDVMGNNYLRFVVWLVAFAAVSGNVAVIVVLVSSRFTFNVSKFLMINLSIADLMMGVYLFIIAVVDLKTRGVYFNYAIDWQHGIGCEITGFITVFAQLLSIFTLTVITLERWFAITFAIQLNRRLKLSLSVKVMIGLWAFVIFMAMLPLFGISSYSKTSICLPMEHKTLADNIYLFSLLVINQLAFLLISACYIKMYVSIISQKTRATMNDKTIAKRMASLVFTDFACWAPISFFGLTAIFGYPLIDVTKSKILLVTIYPLNSCANPFLYVIFTKQYRRDFFILASRYGLCKKKAMQYKNARNMNHYLNHYHQHHLRPTPNSSDLTHRAKQCQKSNPASGSVFSQVSCDGQNVHLYKYICRGHHHHHYCAAYSPHSHRSGSNNHTGNQAHPNHSQHSCSDLDQISDHEAHHHHDAAACSRCISHEHINSIASGNGSGNANKQANKHRKHKRCHNTHHHHPQCRLRNHSSGNKHQRKCSPSRNAPGRKNELSASCCRSAVFSTIDIYPELSNTNSDLDSKHRRHLVDQFEQCSCGIENSSNENECSCQRVRYYGEESESMSQEPHSSSCEKVHIVKPFGKKFDDANNCRVIFTRSQEASKKRKRTNRLRSLMEKIPFAKIAKRKGRSKTMEKESSETSSPYSSSNSCVRDKHNHHRHYRCYSCQHRAIRLPQPPAPQPTPNENQTNPLPIEEQREILRQALQESTTVQEAVAVMEELSSGTRVSMGSSSDSKKTVKQNSKTNSSND